MWHNLLRKWFGDPRAHTRHRDRVRGELLRDFWIQEGFRRGYNEGYLAAIKEIEGPVKIALGLQKYDESGLTEDIDRSRRRIGQSYSGTYLDDPPRTDRGSGAMPCSGGATLSGEVSSGLQGERPELRPDTLRFSTPADADTFPRRDTGEDSFTNPDA